MRKLLSIILAISICMIPFNSYAVDNETENISNTTNNQDNTSNTESENSTTEVEGLEKLEGQKEEVQKAKEEAEQNLEEVSDELTENLQQIAKIDTNIEETQQTLDELSEQIETVQSEIDGLQEELDSLTEEYNSKKELLNQRLVAAYKAGKTQYLDVLLNSSSLSDFISSYFLIQQLVNNDLNLIEVVENEKNEIEDKNQSLLNKKEEFQQQKQIQLKTQNVLENTKTLRNNMILRLSEEEQEIQAQIDEYNNSISELEAEIVSLSKTASFGEDYVGGAMQWPVPGHTYITSYFGMRVHPITGVYHSHSGIDISAPTGTEFQAAAYGIVTKACTHYSYGNMVIIDHGGGVQTLYAHGSSIEVEVGQVVNAGDVVLKVGSTGNSTGPHAHFEIRINGEKVDPLDYVAIPED